ncbi:MAG TPA: CoA transferase [Thermohalobaculum sp.]|nr:CoA transferase [Thermohalobaculum sp.]
MTFAPLEGVRVVEMSHMIMGPSCGMFLAMLGAEVIKVEPPEGDRTRTLTGMAAGFFPLFNRGKRSVRLDLEGAPGRAALRALLARADVFVENFRDGALERRGLAPDALRAEYPRLIVASHKGFLHGPYENRTAMDEVVQMMTGLAYMTGPSGQPLRIGTSGNDIMAGLFGALGVLAALRERERTGEGAALRVGLFENCLLLVAQHMVPWELEGYEAPPMPERDFAWPVYDIFETADGRQIFVGAITAGHWASLCDLLRLERLKDDPRLTTTMDRNRAREWTIPMIRERIAEWDEAALNAALEARGIPFAPIRRPVEMYDDPHVNRPGGLVASRMGDGRAFRAPGLPLEADGAPVVGPADVPGIGDDTEAVLREAGCGEALVREVLGRA